MQVELRDSSATGETNTDLLLCLRLLVPAAPAMESAVNIKSNLEVRCFSARCLPCIPPAEPWEVPTAEVSPCGDPAGPRPWGDPRLAPYLAAFGWWSRCWRAGKGNHIYLLWCVLSLPAATQASGAGGWVRVLWGAWGCLCHGLLWSS